MAKKVIDFLKTLAIKAGANLEDEALKTAIGALNPDAELPDELATAIDNGLLSVASAKNHPEIKKHYFAQAYNGLDKELEDFIAEEKLPDDVVAAIKSETSSTKRAKLLAIKIKELEGKKANAGKSDKEELSRQIVDLNNQLREIKDREQAIHTDYDKKLKDVKKSHVLGGLLSSYKTVFDEWDPTTKNITLNAIITKNLAAKKAELSLDDRDDLILVSADGTGVFGDDNRQLTPKSFLDQVMANEKILKVTENSNNNSSNGSQNGQQFQNGQQRQQFQNNGNNNGNNGNAGKKNGMLSTLLQESQAALELAGKSSVL